MILVKAGVEVGIVSMEIAQRTRVIGVQVFNFWEGTRYGDIDFRDI